MSTSLLQGLLFILLLQSCKSQDVVTSEAPLVADSNLPPTAVIAEEPEVTELTAQAPESVQDVVEVAVEVAVEEAANGAAEAVALEDEVAVDTVDVSQEVAVDAGEEAAAAAEEAAPEEKGAEAAEEAAAEAVEATVEGAGEQAGQEVAAEASQDAVVEAAAEPVEEVPAEPGNEAAAEAGEAGEPAGETAVEVGVEDGVEVVQETGEEVAVEGNETEASQASETEDPGLTPGPADTYVPPQSQGPAIASPEEESNAVGGEIPEESNDLNEIITSKDELLNLVPVEAVPTLDNVVGVEEIPATPSTPLTEEESEDDSELTEATADATEGSVLGLEAWKIGAISAAVFLFLETIVIIVYFLKCRKKTTSPTAPAKAPEDCEAAQTTVEESNENTATADEDQIQQNAISESLDLSQTQEEETMADIPLDPPVNAISPEDPADDVRTSVL